MIDKTHRTAIGSFRGPFFGFPASLEVTRKGPLSANYIGAKMYFPEGFTPNGCKMYWIWSIIRKLFDIDSEDCKIIPEDGINKSVHFKYVFPYIGSVMTDDMATGIAATLFLLIRKRYRWENDQYESSWSEEATGKTRRMKGD